MDSLVSFFSKQLSFFVTKARGDLLPSHKKRAKSCYQGPFSPTKSSSQEEKEE